MENTLLEKDEGIQELENERNSLVLRAQEIEIRTPDQYAAAVVFLKQDKAAQKEATERFKNPVSKARDAWKAICELRDSILNPLIAVEKIVKDKMTSYDREQDRIRADAQAKIDAEARKEREEAAARAQKWADKGNVEKAQEIIAKAESKPVPVVQAATPQIEGVKYITDWKCEITDANAVPDMFWVVDTKAIADFVKSTKGQKSIPGVRIYSEKRIAAGSR